MINVPFDEVRVGDAQISGGRTITETDVVNFCYLTGNWLEIHSNTEFAKKTEFGKRLVQGSLVFSILAGLVDWDPELIIAFYGVDKLRFISPVFIGDTVYVKTEVSEKTVKDDDKGVVAIKVGVYNQMDEMVQICTFKLLVRRKRLER